MKKMIRTYLIAYLLLGLSMTASAAKFSSLEDALGRTAAKIAADGNIPKNTKMAVVGFSDSVSKARWGVSNVIEDDLTSFLIEKMPGRVIAKSHIDTVLKELKITRDDIFDSKNRKQFGKIASADILVSGNYWINRQELFIVITVVNIESGLAFFSDRIRVPKSQLDKNMINLGLNGSYRSF